MVATDTVEKSAKARAFMSWTEFCNKVAVEMCLSRNGTQLLGTFDEDMVRQNPERAVSPFLSIMRKAYSTLRLAHEIGAKEFGA